MAVPVVQAVDAAPEGYWTTLDDGQPVLLLSADEGGTAAAVPCDAQRQELAPLCAIVTYDDRDWYAYAWPHGETLSQRLTRGALARSVAIEAVLRLLDAAAHAASLNLGLGALHAERIRWPDDQHLSWAALRPEGQSEDQLIQDAGVLLYQMITAQLPRRNERGELPLMSSLTGDVDARLEDVVLAALGEPSPFHFETAADLRRALADYLEASKALAQAEASPAAALVARMEENEDFPALSRAIGAISRIADADGEKLQALAGVILRDFSLTNKVLRLANSASYGQFGGNISTVSRAVMVLGFEAIKSLAVSLVLIEHLRDRAWATDLREEVARAFLASLVARKLAERHHYRELEEARIAGMLHLLGRLLAHFYFPDKAAAIERDVALGEPLSRAARHHLGSTYEELGAAAAERWHLPGKLVASLEDCGSWVRMPLNDADRLRLYGNAGSRLMQAALAEDAERPRQLADLRAAFGDVLHMSERDFRSAMEDAARDCLREAAIFGLEAQGVGVLAKLRVLIGLPPVVVSPGPAEASRGDAAPQGGALILPEPSLTAEDRPESLAFLATGLQEISETLASEYQLNDLIRMVLETLQRATGARRVMLATRSVQRQAMVGRFGFGEGVEQLVRGFVLSIEGPEDVLRKSAMSGFDLLLADLGAPSTAPHVPAWYRQLGASRSLLILPLIVDRRAIGLLLADHPEVGGLSLSPREFSILKALRNLALLAIRQKAPHVAH
jgi:HD-like signal output (HDOD) protein